jgi:hypothetical protein
LRRGFLCIYGSNGWRIDWGSCLGKIRMVMGVNVGKSHIEINFFLLFFFFFVFLLLIILIYNKFDINLIWYKLIFSFEYNIKYL